MTPPTAAAANGAVPSPAAAAPPASGIAGTPFTRAQLMHFYELMFTSRAQDEEEIKYKKRNEVYFQISSAGHEAIEIATGYFMKPGVDWVYTHYRSRALALMLGVTPYEMMLQSMGSKEDPHSGGRQMPCHWASRRLRIAPQTSHVGAGFHWAAGAAQSVKLILEHGLELPAAPNEVIVCISGEGTTCQGEFFEALNFACIRNLPVLFLIEDNEYAISTPSEESIAGGNLAKVVSGFPGLAVFDLDGTDLMSCFEGMRKAFEAARADGGHPVLVRAKVTRGYSHSLSDDQAAYRSADELRQDRERDCFHRYTTWLREEGIATDEDFEAVQAKVRTMVAEAGRRALTAPKPTADDALKNLYAPERPAFEESPMPAAPPTGTEPVTLAQAITLTLEREMERDKRIVVFGEDVADCSREEAMRDCKGKGGVFKVTFGLQRKFGGDRVHNVPLAEAGIVGRAIGLATRGLRPVVEIQFFDFIWPAMSQLRNMLASLRYRTNGEYSAPVVVRAPIGGYVRGGGIYHSQSGESIFARCPGLLIAYPSTAADAAGLLRASLRMEDPVLFLEPKSLYYQSFARSPEPGPNHIVPFGKASIRRRGGDVTLVTWGTTVQKSLEAAERLSSEDGVQAEVIDLRTIVPLDMATILDSVRKTGRVLVAAEEPTFAGFSGEVLSQISEAAFEWLDAPPRRYGSLDTWVAYSPPLEEAVLPTTDGIYRKLRQVVEY